MDSIPIFSFIFSSVAILISLFTIYIANRNAIIQNTFTMHSTLFRDKEMFRVLYHVDLVDINSIYFNENNRAISGNFVGSEFEPDVDLFLERLNFVCMWLLKIPPNDEENVFKKYIHRIYTSPFFQQYFSFLDQAESVRISGTYFSFIHKYANERLGLERPNVAFSTCAPGNMPA